MWILSSNIDYRELFKGCAQRCTSINPVHQSVRPSTNPPSSTPIHLFYPLHPPSSINCRPNISQPLPPIHPLSLPRSPTFPSGLAGLFLSLPVSPRTSHQSLIYFVCGHFASTLPATLIILIPHQHYCLASADLPSSARNLISFFF
jgi:hypothetical protein